MQYVDDEGPPRRIADADIAATSLTIPNRLARAYEDHEIDSKGE
jgi:hypothetical protein